MLNLHLSYKYLKLLVALICLSTIGCGQAQIPSKFIETQPPAKLSDEHSALNNAQNEFGVSIVDGQLKVKNVKEIDVCHLNTINGILTGIDRGEWGGKLLFEPSNKKLKTIEIKDGNIKGIFNFQGKIYFIEGLAHMSFSFGALYELDRNGDKFSYKKLIDFEDAPEAFTTYRDEMLVATHSNFYIVRNFQKELIFKDAFWYSLYPNSIAALNDQNIFMGIRGGIVKIDLTDKTFKFYKYQGN